MSTGSDTSSETSEYGTFQNAKYDEYWRIRKECPETKQGLTDILQQAGYVVKKSAKRDELLKLVQKVWMGRLCYDKCTKPELKQFAVARGLVDAFKNPTGRWLADRLMEADEQRTFAKMFDLPPEMRKLIYEFYVSDFDIPARESALLEPTQPPLARTCKTTRNEVLPVFYSTCSFQLRFSTMSSTPQQRVRLRMDPRSFIFLATLAPGCIGDLRDLEIYVFDAAGTLEGCKSFWVSIELGCPGLCDVGYEDKNGMEDEEKQRLVKRSVKRVLKAVKQREGEDKEGRLAMQDFYDLGSAVELALAWYVSSFSIAWPRRLTFHRCMRA